MKYWKYERVEHEADDRGCTFVPTSSVTPEPPLVTEKEILDCGEALAVESFRGVLYDVNKLDFYENVLRDIQYVRCDDPSACAGAALKIKDLGTERD